MTNSVSRRVAALLADLHACVCRRLVSSGALVFRHLSIQLELRYLGMERLTVTIIVCVFITLRLIIDWGGARSTSAGEEWVVGGGHG